MTRKTDDAKELRVGLLYVLQTTRRFCQRYSIRDLNSSENDLVGSLASAPLRDILMEPFSNNKPAKKTRKDQHRTHKVSEKTRKTRQSDASGS